MTVEATIFAALQGLVGSRCYPDIAPANVARPFCTYQQIGGTAVNFIDSGLPSKANARVQINVWADTRAQAALLSRQAESALRATTALQTTVLGQPAATFEEDTRLYGTRQDFSFWT